MNQIKILLSNCRVYIAGPMRGIPKMNFPAFDDCAKILRECGTTVFSPAEMDRAKGYTDVKQCPFDIAMPKDIEEVLKADLIVALPGWEQSRGAILEIMTATAADIPIPVVQAKELIAAILATNYRVGGASYIECTGLITDPVASIMAVRQPHPIPSVNVKLDLMKERIVVDPDTGGQKGQKIERFDLIPGFSLRELAKVYGRGGLKHGDDNWRKGYSWRLSFGAMMRHAWQFWCGESIDEETGCHHLACVAWHCFTLMHFEKEFPQKDDRADAKKTPHEKKCQCAICSESRE